MKTQTVIIIREVLENGVMVNIPAWKTYVNFGINKYDLPAEVWKSIKSGQSFRVEADLTIEDSRQLVKTLSGWERER